MNKQTNPYLEKILRFRILFLITLLFICFISIGIFFAFDTNTKHTAINKENLYKTWKIARVYQKGKLVLNDASYENLRLRINRDSTAEWIRPNYTEKIIFWISADGNTLIKETEDGINDIEEVYEVNADKLRFGKRSIEAHYEYVLIPE